MKEGLVLFAHGSADPQWARPFEQIGISVQKKLPAVAVALAFLEHGTSLEEAVAALAAKGAASIRVVPVFLGTGGHLRKDLPESMASVRRAFPSLSFALEKAVGEDPQIIEAMAAVIAAGR